MTRGYTITWVNWDGFLPWPFYNRCSSTGRCQHLGMSNLVSWI